MSEDEDPQPSKWSWLWDHREELAKLALKVRSWFSPQPGSPEAADAEARGRILIIGPGGVGKSTLGKLLSGGSSHFDVLGHYDESISVEKYPLGDDPEVEIVVPPGQPHRRDAEWEPLLADVSAGKTRGVIILAAYGHHNHGIGEGASYKSHRLYSGNKKQFLVDFLEDRRREEVAILTRLAPHVRSGVGKLWVLTLVTKEDLWDPDSAAANAFYCGGGEYDKLAQTLGGGGPRQVRHEVAMAALVVSNLVTGKGEMLVKTAAGYDQRRQADSLIGLIQKLELLREWEADR